MNGILADMPSWWTGDFMGIVFGIFLFCFALFLAMGVARLVAGESQAASILVWVFLVVIGGSTAWMFDYGWQWGVGALVFWAGLSVAGYMRKVKEEE